MSSCLKMLSHLPGGLAVGDPMWEKIDPNPDIYELFQMYDKLFFFGRLCGHGAVEVKWSARMTLCAGLCCFDSAKFVSIKLSKPILQYRPRADMVDTLLHEMIHAYLFVTQRRVERDAHGTCFQEHMNRINHASGSSITIYHSFHDEWSMSKEGAIFWSCETCYESCPFKT
eukprot:m.50371 g.50371  ORF g.50371 m.50371 type:complete len:171 (+) comp7508_c1_seq5:200-712(+)